MAGGGDGARIIALGQPVAGDDGVGPAVLELLRARALPPGVELRHAREATQLVPLLETPGPVVLVDAVVGARVAPGEVLALRPEQLADGHVAPLSTHGVGVAQAIELARALAPATVARSIRIVGVAIERPGAHAHALSPAVARAVPRAADLVLALLAAAATGSSSDGTAEQEEAADVPGHPR